MFLKKVICIITLCAFAFPLSLFSGCKREQALSSYHLSLVYEEGEISGKLVYKFVNRQNDTFNCLKFNLHANAYRENSTVCPVTQTSWARAFPYGESYGGITIDKVLIDGETASYETSSCGNFLTVQTEEIYPNDSQEVEISFTTVIPKSTLRLGENEDGVNLADFFPTACKIEGGDFVEIPYSPIGDPYYSDVHDYFVSLTLPSEYVVASSGYPTLTEVDENTTTYSYELLSGRDFAFAISKNYNVHTLTEKGVILNYYTADGNGEEILQVLKNCYTFFKDSFGALPYNSISVADVGFCYGGMEFSGLCFVSDKLDVEDKKTALIHELAHQWWHGGVGTNQNEKHFIDEGLAEFSTYLYLFSSDKERANLMIDTAKSAYKSFFSIEELLSGKVDTTMQRELSSFKSEYEYVNIAYNKGLIMFYEYQNAVGLNTAVKNLKKLYGKNYLKNVDLTSLINCLGYGEHFNSFVTGKVII